MKKVKGKDPPDKLKEYIHQDRLHYRLKKGRVKSIHPVLKDLKTQQLERERLAKKKKELLEKKRQEELKL